MAPPPPMLNETGAPPDDPSVLVGAGAGGSEPSVRSGLSVLPEPKLGGWNPWTFR